MSTYYYYSTRDTKKEPLGKVQANTLNEAVQYFTNLKKLDSQSFLSIFTVSRYENHSN